VCVVVEWSGESAQVLSFLRDSALRESTCCGSFTRDAEMARLPPEYQKAVRGAGAGAGAGLCQQSSAQACLEAVAWEPSTHLQLEVSARHGVRTMLEVQLSSSACHCPSENWCNARCTSDCRSLMHSPMNAELAKITVECVDRVCFCYSRLNCNRYLAGRRCSNRCLKYSVVLRPTQSLIQTAS
jgi:hypothetical protein